MTPHPTLPSRPTSKVLWGFLFPATAPLTSSALARAHWPADTAQAAPRKQAEASASAAPELNGAKEKAPALESNRGHLLRVHGDTDKYAVQNLDNERPTRTALVPLV